MKNNDTAREVSFGVIILVSGMIMVLASMTAYFYGNVQYAAKIADGFSALLFVVFMALVVKHALVYWGALEGVYGMYERYVQ